MVYPEEKLRHLKAILSRLNKVAIAYSGGIDSTFLLYSACSVLGPKKVIALQGVSCLLANSVKRRAAEIIEQFYKNTITYKSIHTTPLDWPEFVANDDRRCYYCKRRLYTIFQQEIAGEDGMVLLDGTNADDVKSIRPGFKAIQELRVLTPLLDAGFTKSEIRLLAKNMGLPNHSTPADSCLATRITTGQAINQQLLEKIDKAEDSLKGIGITGCRVRPQEGYVHIELEEKDFDNISMFTKRYNIQKAMLDLELGTAFIAIIGR